jgi:hypothetical protein
MSLRVRQIHLKIINQPRSKIGKSDTLSRRLEYRPISGDPSDIDENKHVDTVLKPGALEHIT